MLPARETVGQGDCRRTRRRLLHAVEHPRGHAGLGLAQRARHRLLRGELPAARGRPQQAHRRRGAGFPHCPRLGSGVGHQPQRRGHHGILGRRPPGIGHLDTLGLRGAPQLHHPLLPRHLDGRARQPRVVVPQLPRRGTERPEAGARLLDQQRRAPPPDAARLHHHVERRQPGAARHQRTDLLYGHA